MSPVMCADDRTDLGSCHRGTKDSCDYSYKTLMYISSLASFQKGGKKS